MTNKSDITMRPFSDFEKDILREMVSDKPETYENDGKKYISNNIGKIMFEHLGVISMSHLTSHEYGHTIEVVVDKQIGKVFTRLFDFVLLLKYLERNDLLGISSFETSGNFQIRNYVKDKDWGWEIQKETAKGETFTSVQAETHTRNTSLANDILRYGNSQYYPSQCLKEMVANDFKSAEQIYVERQLREAKKQTRFAFCTTIIAVLTFLATVIIPLL